jgi:hypothetical protein
MTKKERELELEALLKSNQDRVRASNNIQTSFNAFNDFINVADKRLNNQMDTIDTKMHQFENTINKIQTTQKEAIKSLHKETIQESLNNDFREKINDQYKNLSNFLTKFDNSLQENSKTIEKQYNDLYHNNISVIALKSFHGLFYVFYLLVCIGSLVCFNTVENLLAHKTLGIVDIIGQIILYAFLALAPYWSWKFFLAEDNLHYSDINKILAKASIVGFGTGFTIFFGYAYLYMRF